MPLTPQQLHDLLEMVRRTRASELDCDACLDRVAEFAEHEVAGRPLPAGLEAVRHHLSVCTECRGEYEALQRALERLV